MKKLLALTLILSGGMAYADQCPSTVTVAKGHVMVPAGYTTVAQLPATFNETVPFSQAGYNFYNNSEHHDGRVSCDYIDSANNEIDLVTVQGNIPEPKSSFKNKWEPIFDVGAACNWPSLSTSDCLYNTK